LRMLRARPFRMQSALFRSPQSLPLPQLLPPEIPAHEKQRDHDREDKADQVIHALILS